jgi:hypothetical protein
MGNRAEEMAVYGKPGKRWCCFPPFPQTLEIARREHRNMKILRSDSHIPSAPAASMNQFQIPKGQNPLRLPFASFRLIFGLEKTGGGLVVCRAHRPGARLGARFPRARVEPFIREFSRGP